MSSFANPGFLIGPGDVYRVSTWPIDAYLSGKLRVITRAALRSRMHATSRPAHHPRRAGAVRERTILSNP